MKQIVLLVLMPGLLVTAVFRGLAAEPGPNPSEVGNKHPLPSPEIQREVGDNIEEAFNLAEAKTPEVKIKLAKELAEEAKKATKPDEQYVLLRKAADLACDGGDAGLMVKVVGAMGDAFAIDSLIEKNVLLRRFVTGPRDSARLKSLAEGSAGVIDDALAEDRYDIASDLADWVLTACARNTSPLGKELRQEVAGRRKRVQQLQKQFQEYEKASEALESNPENAKANLAVGVWFCLVKNDWDRGLPHLAKGSDAGLQALARRDLSSPPVAGPEVHIKLADGWWDAAAERRGDENAALLRRAGHWYEQSLPNLQGVDRKKVEGRLAAIAKLGQKPTRPPRLQPPPAIAQPPPAIAPFDAKRARSCQAQWARHLKVPVEFTNSIGMKFVLIPPGEFDMGSTEQEVERLLNQAKQRNLGQWYIDRLPTETPRHRVRITRAFYLGSFEVTQAQYAQVMGNNPSRYKESGPDAPVEMVTWDEAVTYCQRLSALPAEKSSGVYRLPTEAEWEYAARAGTTTAWFFGNDEARLSDYAWSGGNSGAKTHPVGGKRSNAFGLFDVHGNAWEWCADWHAPYSQLPATDPAGPPTGGSRASRVLRGGCWRHDYPVYFRCAYRHDNDPDYRSDFMGFRVARTLTP